MKTLLIIFWIGSQGQGAIDHIELNSMQQCEAVKRVIKQEAGGHYVKGVCVGIQNQAR